MLEDIQVAGQVAAAAGGMGGFALAVVRQERLEGVIQDSFYNRRQV